jgi:hypothetical protein
MDYCIDIIEKKYEQIKQPNIYEKLNNDSEITSILSFIIIYVICVNLCYLLLLILWVLYFTITKQK